MLKYIGWERNQQIPLIYPYINLIKFFERLWKIFNRVQSCLGFPGVSVVKNLPANAGDTGLIPGPGRFPAEENSNTLQYSCWDNLMPREAWCQSIGSQRVRHSQVTERARFTLVSVSGIISFHKQALKHIYVNYSLYPCYSKCNQEQEASAPPESLLNMWNLWFYPDLVNQNLHFNKISRWQYTVWEEWAYLLFVNNKYLLSVFPRKCHDRIQRRIHLKDFRRKVTTSSKEVKEKSVHDYLYSDVGI